MIRFGPSGIPLSCKGRTLLDGVLDVHKLGLTALEIQFLRMSVNSRPVTEDEVEKKAKDVEGKFIIGVNRGDEFNNIFVEDLEKELQVGDMIHFLQGGVAEEFYRYPKIGRTADQLDVKVTVHTPYYMKFTEPADDLVDKSKLGFKYGSVMAQELEADMIMTHLGLIEEGKSPDDVKAAVIENIRELRNWLNSEFDDSPMIGIETQAGEDVFGDLHDIIDVCKKISGVVPVLNFAHLKARGTYDLEESEDFTELFNLCKKFVPGEYYVNFSGVEMRRENEYRFTPIKRGDLNFEVLVDHLLESDDDITIISTSPLKEHDAMYMKVIFERILTKEIGKELRRKKKDAE